MFNILPQGDVSFEQNYIANAPRNNGAVRNHAGVNVPKNNGMINIAPRNNAGVNVPKNNSMINIAPRNNAGVNVPKNNSMINIAPRNNAGVNVPKNNSMINIAPRNNAGVNVPKNNGAPKNNGMGNGILQEPLALPVNAGQSIRGNFTDKHHYFIGSIIHRNDIRTLQNIQRLLKNPLFQNVRWSLPFHTRYIYLGYIDSSVAAEMMNKIFHPLCLAISEKYKKFHCQYEKIKYRNKPPRDRGVKIISAQYKDDGNVINNVLIPYLKKEGLRRIYDVESKVEKPHIDLLYLNCDDASYRQAAEMMPRVKFPASGFEIDHICLIQGTPYMRKFGIPSKYDRLNIDTVKEFYYPLRGSSE